MRRVRRSMQGKLVHAEQRSNTAYNDCDGAVKQQYRLQQEQMGDGDGENDGSEKMVGVVERDERDVEPSTTMANGSRRAVCMMDVDSDDGGEGHSSNERGADNGGGEFGPTCYGGAHEDEIVGQEKGEDGDEERESG